MSAPSNKSAVSLSELGPVMLVGAGKMGMAMAKSWLKAGLKPINLILVDPKPSDATVDFAGQHGLLLLSEVQAEPARVMILAVKPQIMESVLPMVRNAVGTETLILSIAAGISIETLMAGLESKRVVRTMPNTPAQVGKGVTGAVAASGVSDADREATEALLVASGTLLWFENEGELDGVTAVSGSGPAYVFYMVEAMAAVAESLGLSAREATILARQTVIGAAALMEADPTEAAILRQNVTSPGGTTAAALAVLMADDGLKPLLAKAMRAAHKRSVELGA